MTDPIFPEVVIGPLTYISIGVLLTVIIILLAYIYTSRPSKRESLNFKELNLPESRMKVLENVMSDGKLQSNLPEETGYSKATVSQSVEDLNQEDLIKKKKRGNSYLIQAKPEKIREKIDRV